MELIQRLELLNVKHSFLFSLFLSHWHEYGYQNEELENKSSTLMAFSQHCFVSVKGRSAKHHERSSKRETFQTSNLFFIFA